MNQNVRRIFVEKKKNYNIEAKSLFNDIKNNLIINELEDLRILYRYDIEGISDEVFQQSKNTIFSEPPVDSIFEENVDFGSSMYFAVEYLPGQYDQRADSAAQCIQLLTHGERPIVKAAKVIVLEGEISETQFCEIKNYYINPVDSREAGLSKPSTLKDNFEEPENVKKIEGFIDLNKEDLVALLNEYGFAMDSDDILFCQSYFKETERRDPTVTEMRILDTYWSDHCRHTTFLTNIEKVNFEKGFYTDKIKETYDSYLKARKFVYEDREKDICLMDIAVIGMKELKKRGKLEQLDESEEINACSIKVKVKIEGKEEDWLVMFKNETHNHPTEIEPFGGAATCLGGAIRDPLSGRSYVYQAMRVTGSGDPTQRIEDTLEGKLPQRQITVEAAEGYSSYGNQIGLATGLVDEIYHPGYTAKRMEVGAVIAAAPRENVVRNRPIPGDIVVLLGGKTGRDGCGGATGSSKAHTEESIISCGAEVQKGNPPEERKIQRLFRNPKVTTMIKRCNDFGAGGVSVAIGELADGLEINLDAVPKKYKGLDGTELAISESQERMAVVIPKEKEEEFLQEAIKENLEATKVAEVTGSNRVKMFWRKNLIVDISREFLDSNGASKKTEVEVLEPSNKFLEKPLLELSGKFENDVTKVVSDLNVCSKKGLIERFDSSIGKGTVNMPLGGKYQLTPTEAMTARIPTLKGVSDTATIMSYGYNPYLSEWNPFHGAVYAVVESVSKIVASGGDYSNTSLSFQEYFERLGSDPKRWGKPFSALLGAYLAQSKLEIAAIGGKDSMSGSFKDLDVPPTLISFAVNTTDVKNVTSPEFKKPGKKVIYLPLKLDDKNLPDFDYLKKLYSKVSELIEKKCIEAIHTVGGYGIISAISKMCFGNRIGFKFDDEIKLSELFKQKYGSFIIELKDEVEFDILNDLNVVSLGVTQEKVQIEYCSEKVLLDKLVTNWTEKLEKVFKTKTDTNEILTEYKFSEGKIVKSELNIAKPRVIIPVFPGTNCEFDSAKAFEQAGAEVETVIFRNLKPELIEDSIKELTSKIKQSQIIMLPGGFSAGDEPEGSGKFIASVFRNPEIKEAIESFLKEKDGLMLGICNGFQALIKLGLLPYGEIKDIDENAPTLTFNEIGRHVSCMVNTKVVSNLSPWFGTSSVGDIHTIAVSHGEGRFAANENMIEELKRNGQIATQYVDFEGNPTLDISFNPNGSVFAIEGITSPDGRILGKMAHTERWSSGLYKNVPGNKDQKIFESGVNYFK